MKWLLQILHPEVLQKRRKKEARGSVRKVSEMCNWRTICFYLDKGHNNFRVAVGWFLREVVALIEVCEWRIQQECILLDCAWIHFTIFYIKNNNSKWWSNAKHHQDKGDRKRNSGVTDRRLAVIAIIWG